MATAPYDPLINVINAARVRLNDDVETLFAVDGKILDDTQAFSQQSCNTAWRRLQDFLSSLFSVRFENEIIIALAAVTNIDPSSQMYLTWSGFFDGTVLNASPVLPQDLIEPVEVQERPTGIGANFIEMNLISGTLPAIPKQGYNDNWQWRNDGLYMPGALVNTDIRIRYASYLADFVDGAVPWFNQPVPIMRCLDPLASYICAEYARARENLAAVTAYSLDAENSARMITGRDYMEAKNVQKTGEYAKMRDRYTPQMEAGQAV
jgi:hypothetical protein